MKGEDFFFFFGKKEKKERERKKWEREEKLLLFFDPNLMNERFTSSLKNELVNERKSDPLLEQKRERVEE